ncbi:MAG: 30S ribosomal protein S7 [Chloroflexi bacterium]|nr:30S ribosomal protein S7 [Chloroflexota bacterium]
MPRRGEAPVRKIIPDPRYNSELVARFINKLMTRGKKTTAMTIMYDALALAEDRTKKPAMQVLDQAMRNATPLLEVRPRRVGGATLQVPMEIRADRRMSLAIRWLVNSARTRPGKSMAEKLAAELLDASNNVGNTVRRREETHRMAEANKAFAHYRW